MEMPNWICNMAMSWLHFFVLAGIVFIAVAIVCGIRNWLGRCRDRRLPW